MDFVEEVLRFLTARMQIEAEWAVQERTSFTWWAHTLAQRVWVAPAARISGRRAHDPAYRNRFAAPTCRSTASTWTRLANVNQFATLSAYVADTAQRTIRLHSSVSLTAENWLLARSIALACDGAADGRCLRRGAGPGGRIRRRRSRRRRIRDRGLRDRPDEMVDILEIYQQRGEGESPFTADEIAELVHLEPRPWTMAANELQRLDCRSGVCDGPAGAPRVRCVREARLARQRPADAPDAAGRAR